MAQFSGEDSVDLREAQDWGKVLSSGGTEEHNAFARWARNSTAHISAFLQLTAVNVELAGLDANRDFDLERLIAEITGSNRASCVDSRAHY
jgi:ferric-dicitrate binding protein FerR (iron transport regulator)